MPVQSSEERVSRLKVLVEELVDQIEGIITEAEAKTRPLEVDPYRSKLFEVFVVANASGLLTEKTPNLTSETMTSLLAGRWKLREVVDMASQQKGPVSDEHLRKMQLLWSILRMWMEWTYAWGRWDEFHQKRAEG